MLKLTYLYFTITIVILTVLPLNILSNQNQVTGDIDIVGKKIELPIREVTTPNLLAKKLLKEMVKDGYELSEELKVSYQKGLLEYNSFFSTKEIDFNNDGKPELVVRQSDKNSICRGQNCPIWILSKEGKSYKLLLKELIGNFELVTLKNKNLTYYDLLLTTHSSTIQHELKIHKFNGTKYNVKKCVTETFTPNTQDNTSYQYKEHPCD